MVEDQTTHRAIRRRALTDARRPAAVSDTLPDSARDPHASAVVMGMNRTDGHRSSDASIVWPGRDGANDITVWPVENLPFVIHNADTPYAPALVAAAAWELRAIEPGPILGNPMYCRELFQRVPEILFAPGEFTTTIRVSVRAGENGPLVTTSLVVAAVGDDSAVYELGDACRQIERHVAGPHSPFRLQRKRIGELDWPAYEHAALIRQQLISVGDPVDGHVMPVRFAHPGVDASLRLLDSLQAACPVDFLVSVTPTRLHHTEERCLHAARQAAASAAEEGDSRRAATALDAMLSYRTDLYVTQIMVASEAPIGAVSLRAIATSITAGFDAERHLGQRVVARPHAFVSGGASIEPVRCPAEELGWLRYGLPRRGFGDERDLVDLMTPTEVAFAYSFLVGGDGTLPGVARQGVRAARPQRTEGALSVGTDPFGDPVLLSASDRFLHLVVMGATGSGKSTLLIDLAAQDMRAGRTVVVLNPSADLAARVADEIPERRRDHVYYLDADRGAGDTLHLLHVHRGGHIPLLANVAALCEGMVADLNKDFAGPVWRRLILSTARACALGNVPLRELPEVLLDAARLNAIAEQHDDRELSIFAQEAAGWSSNVRAEYSTWGVSKMYWASLPGIAETFDAGYSTFDLGAALDGPAIILVDLGADPTSAALLTSTLLSLITALTSRRTMSSRPMAIYVDEAHRVAGQNLRRVMLEARKRNIALTLATQTVTNLDNHADVLLGNAGNIVVGRCASPTSAHAEHVLGVPAAMFPRLANFRAMARLTVDGQPRDAVEVAIAPPRLPVATTVPDWLLESASRRRSLVLGRGDVARPASQISRFDPAATERDGRLTEIAGVLSALQQRRSGSTG